MSLEEAIALRRAGKYQEGIRLLERLWVTLASDQRLERIACLNEQSQCLWRSGQQAKAETRAREALQLAEESPPDLRGQGNALNNLGVIYLYRGELNQAETFLEQSLTLREQVGDLQAIAGSLNNLGIVYYQRGELDRAEECHKRNLALFEEIGGAQRMAFSLSNLALCYWQRGELGRAEEHYQRSLALREQYGNPQDIAEARYQLLRILLLRGVLEGAIDQVDQLAQLVSMSKLPDIAVKHHLAMGLLRLKQHNLGLAVELGFRAKAQAVQIPHFELQVNAMMLLVEALLQLYMLTKQVEHKVQVETMLRELEELSKREQLHQTYIETVLMQAFLKRATFDLPGATDVFKLAELLAEERGFRLLAQKARVELLELQKQEPMFQRGQKGSSGNYEQAHLEKMISFLQSLKGPATFDPSQLFMLAIRLTDRGPVVFVFEDLPFREDKPEGLFAKTGVFYSTAIGQGAAHHEGLYGPLPMTPSYSCLVYAQILPDEEQQDMRIPGKTYTMLCLGYPNGLDHFFADREALVAIFEEWTEKIQDVSEITLEFLADLRDALMTTSLMQPATRN